MDIKKNLDKISSVFGFTNAMGKLYLAGLESGPILMMPLAKKARLKRTTSYYLMQELIRRGYFTTCKIGKRTGYMAVSPTQLLAMMRERQRQVHKLLPTLKLLYKNRL